MIEPSPDRQSYNKRIQETQSDIDKADNKLDGAIDIKGLNPEEKEAMKITYIDKVNMVQGKVHRSFQKIDIQRNLRSPRWRKWEEAVLGVELGLLKALRSARNSPTTELVEFTSSIDALLREIDTVDNTFETSEQATEAEPLVPRSIDSLFHAWDVPGSDTEVASKAKKAIAHYGEEKIRNLDAALSLYDALDPSLRERLFNSTVTVRLQQLAGQLANGTFESSPLSFLLTEDFGTIEDLILMERESVLDDIDVQNAKVQTLHSATNEKIAALCEAAGFDEGKDYVLSDIYSWIANTNGKPKLQEEIIDAIRSISTQMTALQEEINTLYPQVTSIEKAFNAFDTARALNIGNKKEEAQLRFRGAMEYGVPFPNFSELQQYLRSTQKNLIEGKPEKALRVSIDELNLYMQQNPNLDTLDRIDVLSLRSVRDRGKTSAKFTEYIQSNHNPFEIHTRERPKLKMHIFANSAPQTYTRIAELGVLDDGREIILVELPEMDGRPKQKVIALRNMDGVVQLQGGTVLENPREILPIRIDARHERGETVYVTPETKKYLRNTIGFGGEDRVTLRGSDDRFSAQFVEGVVGEKIRTLDLSQLQHVKRNDDGIIRIYNANDKEEESFNEELLRKERIEHGGDVLQSIDKNPLVQDITQRAGGLQGNMQNMQKMLGTAMDSNATTQGAFIDQLRSYARPMLETMEDPTTLQNVVQAKKLLQSQLSRVQLGSFTGNGIERAIQDRIDALEGYITVLDDNQLKNALQKAMELKPDEWGEWLSTDGLIMLGAITAAVVASTALIVFTGGVGLIAVSAVGAAGGIAGAELTKEGLHYGYNTWGGASTGEYRYTDRSRIGAYLVGQKLYDPKTKEFIDMSFLENVASPYVGEFLLSFGTTALALGAGQMAGKALSQLAQNTKFLQNLAKNNGVANSIMKKLSGLADDAPHIPKNLKEFARKTYEEIVDEFKDEFILEAGVAQGLMRIDKRLAFLSTFIVATGKGFKPLRVSTSSYSTKMSNADVKAWVEEGGHTLVSVKNGVYDIQTYEGHKLILHPETAEEAALNFAKKKDAALLKAYMKTHDIDDGTRITLAEALLGRTMDQVERDALIAAHKKPGVIDQLTPAELKAKTEELRKSSTLTKAERRLLIEAGLAGVGTLEAPATISAEPVRMGDALNPESASRRLENEGEFTEVFTATGKGKTAEFEVKYSGSGRVYTAEIRSPDYPRVEITVQYQTNSKTGVRQAYVQLGKMGELSGAGLYASIMSELFEGVDFIEGSVGNEETNALFRDHSQEGSDANELEALDGDYKEPHTVPYSVLMTYSPTASVRKGFITRAEMGTPIDLISERIKDPELQSLLDLSQGWERSRRVDTPHYTRKFYEQHPNFSLGELTQKFKEYLQSHPDLDASIAESLSIQIEHMASFTKEGSTDNGLNYKQQVIVYLNANTIGNPDRISLATDLLGRALTPQPQGALLRAHKVGMDREGASIGNYTDAELFKKGRILMAKDSNGKPLFSRAEADLLLETGLAGIPGRIGSWVKGLLGKKPEKLPQERISPNIREELGSKERTQQFESLLDFLEKNITENASRNVDENDVNKTREQMEKEGYTNIKVQEGRFLRTSKRRQMIVSGQRPFQSTPKQVQELLPFCQHFADPVRAIQTLHRLCHISERQLSSRSDDMQRLLTEPNAEELLLTLETIIDKIESVDLRDIPEVFATLKSLSETDLASLDYLHSRSGGKYSLKRNAYGVEIAQNPSLMEIGKRIPQNPEENIIDTLHYLVQYDVHALHDILDIAPDILTGSLSNVRNGLSEKGWQKLLNLKNEDRQLVKNMYEHEPTEPTESVVDTVVILSENPHFLAVCNFCKNTNIRGLLKVVEDSHNSRNSNTEDVLRKRMNDEQWMNTIQDPAFVQFLVRLEREFGLTVNFSDIVNDGNIYELWMNKDVMTKIENPQFKKLLLYYVKRVPFTGYDVDVPKGYSVIPKSAEGEPVISLSGKPAIEVLRGTDSEQEKVWAQLALAQDQYPHLVDDLLFLRDTYGIDYSSYEIQVFLDKGPNFVFIPNSNLSFLGKMQNPKSTARKAVYDEKVKSNYQLLQEQVGYKFSFEDLNKLRDFDPQNNKDDRLALEAAQSLMGVWNQDVLFTIKQVSLNSSGHNESGTFFSEKELLLTLAKSGKAEVAAKAYQFIDSRTVTSENVFQEIATDQIDDITSDLFTPENIAHASGVFDVLQEEGLYLKRVPSIAFLSSIKGSEASEIFTSFSKALPEEFMNHASEELWSRIIKSPVSKNWKIIIRKCCEEDPRRFLTSGHSQLWAAIANDPQTEPWRTTMKAFATNNVIVFASHATQVGWKAVLGDAQYESLLASFPKDKKDIARYVFTHHKNDRATGYIKRLQSYMDQHVAEDSSLLSEHNLPILTQFISEYGLSNTPVIFLYYRNIKLVESGQLDVLPQYQTEDGITSLEILGQKTKELKAKVYGDQIFTNVSNLSTFEKDLLSSVTGKSNHSFDQGRLSLDSLLEQFDYEFTRGFIAPLPSEFETIEISVSQSSIEFDPSSVEGHYEVFQQEMLQSMEKKDTIEDLKMKAIFALQKSMSGLQDNYQQSLTESPRKEGKVRNLEKKVKNVEETIEAMTKASSPDAIVQILLPLEETTLRNIGAISILREVTYRKFFQNNDSAQIVERLEVHLRQEKPSADAISAIVDFIDEEMGHHVINLEADNSENYWDATTWNTIKGSMSSKKNKKLLDIRNMFNPHIKHIKEASKSIKIQETAEIDTIRMIPDRGFVGDMAGYLGDACYTNPNKTGPLLKNNPDVVPYKFVKEIETENGKEYELMGSVLCFERDAPDGKVMIVRAFNVPKETESNIHSFIEKALDGIAIAAKKRGCNRVLFAGPKGTSSNYDMTHLYVERNYVIGHEASVISDTFDFNGADITQDLYEVRSLDYTGLVDTVRDAADADAKEAAIQELKNYCKAHAHTLTGSFRLDVASLTLNRPLTPVEQQRILDAHKNPGDTDAAAKEDILTRKGDGQFTAAEAELLLAIY